MLSTILANTICLFEKLVQKTTSTQSYQSALENYLSRRSITDTAQLEVYMREFIYQTNRDNIIK